MLVLAPLAAVILFACVQTALAAVQLNFFNVIAFPTSVMLEWSTAGEVNLAGFDIQCKQANEPDTAYHEIGFQPAKGGPDVGALYDFPVTSGLVPGNSYCFRLKEITTDGSPGEVFDRCGYGPMVTPTPGFGAIPVFTPVPVQTDAFGNPIVPTPTPQIPVVATDAFGNPITQIPGAVPTDAFGNPIPPTPVNPTSPLAPPQAVATDAFGNPLPPTPAPQAVATDAFGNPLPQRRCRKPSPRTPSATHCRPLQCHRRWRPMRLAIRCPQRRCRKPSPRTPSATRYQQPVLSARCRPPAWLLPRHMTPMATRLPRRSRPQPWRPTCTAIQSTLSATRCLHRAAHRWLKIHSPRSQQPAPEYVQPATPTPAYVVVTATPTEAPVALAPVYTPLPTATPLPAGVQLASSLQPSGQNLTQNLMIMLLCLTFTGATGIGIIGLITSVMFMRARSSQRDFYERTSVRRRL